MDVLTKETRDLLVAQKNEWELARKNFTGLDKVQVRTFQFDGFKVKVQFNPVRIVSSAAKVDKKSIEARPCFLCEANRPKEQRGVAFNDFSILVNPFPIFPEHFTIPGFAHTPQRIQGNFGNMLDLARVMQEFTVFYNGPKCGASAPDHFHFQAGNSDFMPINNEIDFLKESYGTKLFSEAGTVWSIKDGLRNFIFLESTDKKALKINIESIYQSMKVDLNEEEPMMNILASFHRSIWRVFIFPRALHRPTQYFEEGEKNILLSPASVDMGGVFITPLEKDFKKIRKDDIKDILAQVLLDEETFDKLIELIKTKA
ncbi:DUF4922 domain-containing protein [Prolixibacteraceae bacterium Z1-6]|uniref:GDP-D-glucose phosphorylase 1 n=1 Tax=Draconibacterium aestuarii TaxID=2998507 RepID=A0A9X3J6B1_9BACT|nr:DUF4922 domain-containing protein [Prolixibacteraceae bacterium Z1-6]